MCILFGLEEKTKDLQQIGPVRHVIGTAVKVKLDRVTAMCNNGCQLQERHDE
jgi:hypothetical protein